MPLSIGDNQFHERFMVMATAYAAIGLASIRLPQVPEAIRALRLGAVVVAGAWCLASVASIRVNVPMWGNNLFLWSWAYHKHPDSFFAQTQLLHTAVVEQRYEIARPIFEAEVKKGALEIPTQLIYGYFLINTGEPEEGIKYLEGVVNGVSLDDSMKKASVERATGGSELGKGFMYLAQGQIAVGDYAGAMKSVENAYRFLPDHSSIRLLESDVLLATDRIEEADAALARVRANLPVTSGPAVDQHRRQTIRTICAREPQHAYCPVPSGKPG
jgi:tetratricopeptide (TPR) repeat protein